MSGKIIDSHRYKKVSRAKVKKNKSQLSYKNSYTKKIKKRNISNRHSSNMSNFSSNLISKAKTFDDLKDNTLKEEKKERIKQNFEYSKLLKLTITIFAIIAAIVIARIIFDINKLDIISVFSNDNSNKAEGLVSDYTLNIGVSKLDTTNYLTSRNVILNELLSNTTLSLVKMNKDYNIEYKVAEKIESISDTCYLVTLNPIYKVTVNDIINSYNNIKNAGTSNIYYENILNFDKFEQIDENTFKIYVKKSDPFFIYKMNFPITSTASKSTSYTLSSTNSNNVSISRNASKSNLSSINLKSFEDTDDMVADFRAGNIDVFTASSDSIMQLIGKREYNVKKYRDGETIFLLGNSKSSLFRKKEVRQALAYCINRDEIVKNIDSKFSEVIDIPYIYSDVKYKYDLYAAENVLVLNGWKKSGGIYNKNEGYEYKKLELNLLVNKDDVVKSKIADNVKDMVEKVGIRVNVLKLSQKEINDKVSTGDYDMVLSTLNINDSPDIEYIYNYLNVNDITNAAIENVRNSNISNIEENINVLKDSLSSEVACIGILAKTTNVVYQKYITGFDNISYMRVFDNLESIGKVIN